MLFFYFIICFAFFLALFSFATFSTLQLILAKLTANFQQHDKLQTVMKKGENTKTTEKRLSTFSYSMKCFAIFLQFMLKIHFLRVCFAILSASFFLLFKFCIPFASFLVGSVEAAAYWPAGWLAGWLTYKMR